MTDYSPRRRTLLAAACCVPFATSPSRAESFPAKPITLIIPYPAGGPTDVVVRVLAEEARKTLGHPVVVENRPGANGSVGAATLARASADGYTLAVIPQSVYREPYLNKTSYDPLTSFTYIALLTDFTFGIAVRNDAPWKSFKEFVADAMQRPNKLSIGSGGGLLGTPNIAAEEVVEAAKVKVNVVPFKGDSEVVNALLGSHIDAAVLSGVAVPHIESGKMRYVGAFTEKRIARFPSLPTIAEQGYPVWVDSPYGIAGPKGMDPTRVKVIQDAFKLALESPAGTRALQQLNQRVNYLGSDDYRKFAISTYAREEQRVKRLRELGRVS